MTYDQWKTDSGYHEITPEQEREIEAREECKRRGLDPDDDAADGIAVWMVVDKELFEAMPLNEDPSGQRREATETSILDDSELPF